MPLFLGIQLDKKEGTAGDRERRLFGAPLARYAVRVPSARPWEPDSTLRFLLLLPVAMALSGLGMEGLARGLGAAGAPRPVWLMAVGTGLFHVAALGVVHGLVRAHGVRWGEAFGLFRAGWPGRWVSAILWTLPALAGAWGIHQGSIWLLEWASVPHDSQAAVEAVRRAGAGWELGVLFVFAVLTAPVVEEVLFRGVLWPLARDRGWRVAGAIGVSLLFALIHLNVAAILPLWGLGLFWIWMYERTGDLTAPILSHALFNGVNFAWLLVADPGGAR